jgi:hypothetical protein
MCADLAVISLSSFQPLQNPVPKGDDPHSLPGLCLSIPVHAPSAATYLDMCPCASCKAPSPSAENETSLLPSDGSWMGDSRLDVLPSSEGTQKGRALQRSVRSSEPWLDSSHSSHPSQPISHQPSATSHLPSPISHLPSPISHLCVTPALTAPLCWIELSRLFQRHRHGGLRLGPVDR